MSSGGIVTKTAPTTSDSDVLQAVVVGDGHFATHVLPATGAADFGRAPDCDVVVHDASMSRRHLRLHVGDVLRVEDLRSKNGTSVKGGVLNTGEKVEISLGEAFRAGSVTIVVQRSRVAARPRRLWTHAYFETKLDEECARAERSGASLALLRVHCHDAADVPGVLDVLFDTLEPVDVVGSYAPGEYEVLIADAGHELAQGIAERTRRRLADGGFRAGVGLAVWPHGGRNPYALFAAADDGATGRSPAHRDDTGPIIASEVMRRMWAIAERAGRSETAVLIFGETGVGKELFADAIHRASARHGGPMVCVSCAELSASLIESELFGHERGAFTGAQTARPGLLEAAHGGTLFLDEIGEMPLALQPKLLRVLEARMVQRLGGLKPQPIDVRFVAATNRDLEAEVARGTFRQDLYYRIAGFILAIPPLRERLEEIEPLARRFLEQVSRQSGRPIPLLSDEALEHLRTHRWPGNIRELNAAMARAVLLCSRGVILPEHLSFRQSISWASPVHQPGADASPQAQARDSNPGVDLSHLPESAQEAARSCIEALARCAGNQTRAAKLLGISRRTLIYRLDRYGIPRPRG